MNSSNRCKHHNPDICNAYYAKGMCKRHYMRVRNNRPLDAPLPKKRTGCDHPGCDRPHNSKGFCHAHYMQRWETGQTWDLGSTKRGYTWRIRDENGRPTRVKACSIGGCSDQSRRNGLCAFHSQQKSQGMIPRGPGDPACPILDCPAMAKSYGVCHKHKAASVRFGLTVESLTEMFRATGGECGTCGRRMSLARESERRMEPHIDHDHACCPGSGSCGKCVRGVICRGCNMALGSVEDSPETLDALATYLRTWNEGRR